MREEEGRLHSRTPEQPLMQGRVQPLGILSSFLVPGKGLCSVEVRFSPQPLPRKTGPGSILMDQHNSWSKAPGPKQDSWGTLPTEAQGGEACGKY